MSEWPTCQIELLYYSSQKKCGLGSNPCFEGPVINYVEGEQAKKRGKRQVKLYSYEKNRWGGAMLKGGAQHILG